MSHEHNFVHPAVQPGDVELFLGPLTPDDGPFTPLPPEWTMAHVMHAAGLFPSVGQARKNGWAKPVPPGYSQYTVSKRKVRVYVLNAYAGMLAA